MQGVSSVLICYARIEAFIAETARSSVLSPLWSWRLRDSTMSLHYTSHRSVESTKKGIVDKMFRSIVSIWGGKVVVPEVAIFKGVGRGFLAGRVAASWYLYGNPVCESQTHPYEG